MPRKRKPLTPEQEEFYASFKPHVPANPDYIGPPSEGDEVLITGKHPWAGSTGVVVGYRLCAGAGVGMLIDLPNAGTQTFVFKGENIQILKRNGTNGRELIEALLSPKETP